MKKTKAGVRRPRRRRSPRPLRSYLRQVRPPLSSQEKRALRAGFPRSRALLPTSLWLAGGIERARSASGLGAVEVIALLDAFVRWTHAIGIVPVFDVALQVTQLELLRRRAGAAPRAARMPTPRRPDEPTPEESALMVAHWEALSYAHRAAEPGDDDDTCRRLLIGALGACGHLASAHGVPVRWALLDPVQLAVEQMGAPAESGGVPKPDGYTACVLDSTALLCERGGEQGWIDPGVAADLARELRTLVLGWTTAGAA